MFYGNFHNSNDLELLKKAVSRFPHMFGRTFFGDNSIVLGKTLSFLDEARFQNSMQRQARNDQERSLVLRLNTLIWAMDNALNIDGDIVECGVWRGFCFGFLTDYFDFQNVTKTLWLYDTFAGIPPEYDTENHDSDAFRETNLYENVIARFAPFPNVRVVRGLLPMSLEGNSPDRISLLHMDLNSSKAEIETLEVLFDRVVAGGMIVFDDYGWTAYRAQHIAEKAWMAERGYRILETPNGQGVLLKR